MIVNLGSPASPSKKDVRAYLSEFLRDPRVVQLPKWLWWPLLFGLILPFRSKQSAKKYSEIWTEHGSPLHVLQEKQSVLLQANLNKTGNQFTVMMAMRYGKTNTIAQALQKFEDKGVSTILVIPIYPQFSFSTTMSVLDMLRLWNKQCERPFDISYIKDFHQYPYYIKAIALSIKRHWQAHGRGEKLLLSFHSLPQRYIELGDPYGIQCLKTSKLIASELGLSEHEFCVCFQSKIGKTKWLEPSTHQVLRALLEKGIKSVDVVCPGFPCDCLETLEEINITERKFFLAHGGEYFQYIPCMNENNDFILALAYMVSDSSLHQPLLDG